MPIRSSNGPRRPYWVATAVVLFCWVIAIGISFWSLNATVQEGQLHFHPAQLSEPALGDRYATYDHQHTYFVNVSGFLVLILISVSLSLGMVNGMVFLSRRRHH